MVYSASLMEVGDHGYSFLPESERTAWGIGIFVDACVQCVAQGGGNVSGPVSGGENRVARLAAENLAWMLRMQPKHCGRENGFL